MRYNKLLSFTEVKWNNWEAKWYRILTGWLIFVNRILTHINQSIKK